MIKCRWINHASQDLAGNYERKTFHYSILMRISMPRLQLSQRQTNSKVNWEVKHRHCHLLNPPSIPRLSEPAPPLDPVSLSSDRSDRSLLGMPTGRRKTNMAVTYCVPVLLSCCTEKSADFTSGRVCGPSSSFWGVCHFQPTFRWTLAVDPPACRNPSGLAEGRTGALRHQVGDEGVDLRGRSPRWQPCH